MDQKLEAEIVAKVLKGDRQEYALLVEKYKSPIYNLAYRMTGNLEDAGDLAQETFVRAFQHLQRFDPDKIFFTWLYTISLNIIKNHLRKKREVTAEYEPGSAHLTGPAGERENPEQLFILHQQADVLDACLQKLPVDLREAIILRFYAELSFEEVAAISGASLSAVKMRVYRGLERLKQLMSEFGSEHSP
jgi:RNA polymerase sigma-70 factor (ECF subfamily)